MKLHLVKELDNRFSIAHNSDFEKAKKLKAGDMFLCEIRKPRNIRFHRKYFALINMLFDNQELYNNIDHLREDLTIEAGYYTKHKNIHGDFSKKANSISFSKMDEIEFNELYSKTIDVIIKYFHFDRDDILLNIERYF